MNQEFFFDQSILALLFKINSFIFFYPCWLLLLTHTLTHLIFFVFVYMFVCLFTLQCTKQKTWKDIAAQLGIGASSSGAYTLKKHYGKNLLPFECYYDRGGIDPGPILAQVRQQRSSIILSTNIDEKFCKQEEFFFEFFRKRYVITVIFFFSKTTVDIL